MIAFRRGTGLVAVACGLALCLALAVPGSARATSVTYSTTGNFTPGTDATGGGNSITITSGTQSLVLSFVPQGSVTVNTPVVGAIGSFVVDASNIMSSNLDIPTVPTPSTFELTINQTAPTSGTGSFAATLAGTVSFNSGFVQVIFNNTSTTIGGVTYGLVNLGGGGFPDNVQLLDPNATGAGVSGS
jgi:hypothetical protein